MVEKGVFWAIVSKVVLMGCYPREAIIEYSPNGV